jgi:GTPase SAR1 family protein
MATNKNDNRKIFIVGDKGCGKRTLISAFKYDQFIADQVEFRYGDTYVADIPVDGKTVSKDKIRFLNIIFCDKLFR